MCRSNPRPLTIINSQVVSRTLYIGKWQLRAIGEKSPDTGIQRVTASYPGDLVAGFVGVPVSVGVAVFVGVPVLVGVEVLVGVGVFVTVGVGVGDLYHQGVGLSVIVGVGIGVAV